MIVLSIWQCFVARHFMSCFRVVWLSLGLLGAYVELSTILTIARQPAKKTIARPDPDEKKSV